MFIYLLNFSEATKSVKYTILRKINSKQVSVKYGLHVNYVNNLVRRGRSVFQFSGFGHF